MVSPSLLPLALLNSVKGLNSPHCLHVFTFLVYQVAKGRFELAYLFVISEAPIPELASWLYEQITRCSELVPPDGLEPSTRGLEGRCSCPLSYGGKWRRGPDSNRRRTSLQLVA